MVEEDLKADDDKAEDEARAETRAETKAADEDKFYRPKDYSGVPWMSGRVDTAFGEGGPQVPKMAPEIWGIDPEDAMYLGVEAVSTPPHSIIQDPTAQDVLQHTHKEGLEPLMNVPIQEPEDDEERREREAREVNDRRRDGKDIDDEGSGGLDSIDKTNAVATFASTAEVNPIVPPDASGHVNPEGLWVEREVATVGGSVDTQEGGTRRLSDEVDEEGLARENPLDPDTGQPIQRLDPVTGQPVEGPLVSRTVEDLIEDAKERESERDDDAEREGRRHLGGPQPDNTLPGDLDDRGDPEAVQLPAEPGGPSDEEIAEAKAEIDKEGNAEHIKGLVTARGFAEPKTKAEAVDIEYDARTLEKKSNAELHDMLPSGSVSSSASKRDLIIAVLTREDDGDDTKVGAGDTPTT